VNTLRQPVSVCLASRNGELYIEAQIHSVLVQLQPRDELIISDDASTDHTIELVKKLADPRVQILQNTRPLGVIKNFENALSNAKHNYIFLCDQDDIWLPGKVDKCLTALEGAELVVTDCQVVDTELRTMHPSFFSLRGSRPGIVSNLWKNSYLGCCMAFRKSVLQQALPIPSRVPMHDMWLGLVAQTRGPVVFLPEILSLYRRHPEATSDTAGISRASLLQQIGYRFRLLCALLCRVVFKK
jgi:glycosyltransferase involved in cell wall biosynthesis